VFFDSFRDGNVYCRQKKTNSQELSEYINENITSDQINLFIEDMNNVGRLEDGQMGGGLFGAIKNRIKQIFPELIQRTAPAVAYGLTTGDAYTSLALAGIATIDAISSAIYMAYTDEKRETLDRVILGDGELEGYSKFAMVDGITRATTIHVKKSYRELVNEISRSFLSIVGPTRNFRIKHYIIFSLMALFNVGIPVNYIIKKLRFFKLSQPHLNIISIYITV